MPDELPLDAAPTEVPAEAAQPDAEPHAAPADPLPAAGFGSLLWLLLALAAGLAVRVGWAREFAGGVAEWEADGFVWTLLGRPEDALNRLRAPGGPWLLGRLGDVWLAESILAVRLICVGLSAVGLLAAVVAAGCVARLTDLTQRSLLRAAAWMAWIWAVHPSLVASSISPVPEVVVAIPAALLVAGLAWRGAGGGLPAWLFSLAAATCVVLVGGSAWAVLLVVGLVVFLAPVPRPIPAVGAGLLVAAALAVGAWVQAGDDPERPWLPDTAPMHSLLALGPHADRSWGQTSSNTDLRELEVVDLVLEDVVTVPGELALALLERLAFEQLGPDRFLPVFEQWLPDVLDDPDANPTLPLGLFDLFVRGGLILFALTVLGIARPKSESAWPRGAVVVGWLVGLFVLTAGAIGPFALVPLDVVLLGLAGAGVVGMDPRRPWPRRIAFVVGGALLCSFLFAGGWRPRPLRPWTTELTHINGDGGALVPLLVPETADPRMAANLLMMSNAPLLRMPRHALDQALLALERDPTSPEVNELYVRALVECGRFEEAAQLAEAAHTGARGDKRRKVFFEWVLDEQRRVRAPRDR